MRFSFLFLLLGTLFSLTAQEQNFSPFPSRLKTYISGGEVILTWQDSRDLESESYLIFRSNEPIDEDFINNSNPLAVIDKGIMIFTDRPEQGGNYYYGIICKDETRAYPICLPYRNCTALPVVLEEGEVEADLASVIENLQASIVDGKVELRFDASRIQREIAVYRSPEPINVGSDLNDATLLRILDQEIQYYLDSPLAGISYYYAVVDYRLEQSNGENIIYPGNHLISPIEIPLHDFMEDRYWATEQRRAPLPEIRLDRFYQDLPDQSVDLPARQNLELHLASKLDRFLNLRQTDQASISWMRLAPELGQSEQPLEQELQAILDRIEDENNWSNGVIDLLALLRISHNEYLEARIYYYLGQCHYFLDEQEQAYLDFTLSAELYPLDSNQWMDIILNSL